MWGSTVPKERWADADAGLSNSEKKKKREARGKAAAQIFDDFRQELEDGLPEPANPWKSITGGPVYEAAIDQFPSFVAIPILQGAASNTGRLGKMIDAWVSYELRRAGFGANEVWPRSSDPRIWPSEFTRLLDHSLASQREVIRDAIDRAGVSQADMLGRHYFKQVDVLLSSWDRGPELMVSTKAQMSSFGNNLNNRFEEFVGDAHNLKGRFPLAALGIVFVVRSTIESDGDRLARLVDMLRKLRGEDLYDSTCLIAVEHDDDVFLTWPDPLEVKGGWNDHTGGAESTFYPAMRAEMTKAVTLRGDLVPKDLAPDQGLAKLVGAVLERTPVTEHKEVRARRNLAG